MVNSQVLVLNRSFLPVHVTTVRRAFTLLYIGLARAVDEEFKTFDFDSWAALSVAVQYEDSIGLVGRTIRIPRVIMLQAYDRLPKRHVRFSRLNIYTRDRNTCQYCGRVFPKSELNLDHVIPRSQGGTSCWENIVCCCLACNRVKGGRTPEQAGMYFVARPRRPRWTPYLNVSVKGERYRAWLPFLDTVDVSYWNAQLKEE
jgi:5-methylcytosine-specific restriction endonuclease McrA